MLGDDARTMPPGRTRSHELLKRPLRLDQMLKDFRQDECIEVVGPKRQLDALDVAEDDFGQDLAGFIGGVSRTVRCQCSAAPGR